MDLCMSAHCGRVTGVCWARVGRLSVGRNRSAARTKKNCAKLAHSTPEKAQPTVLSSLV